VSCPDTISIFLCGDVMTGRGIDQTLPHPGSPVLYEAYVRDARDYVRLAEEAHGPIPRPLEPGAIWGDAPAELERAGADLRIVNLETSITTSDDAWPDKPIHYRMHPRNIACLTAAGIDCCSLANNHVLDWGYAGLTETLRTLDAAGIARAGAGEDAEEAATPAVLEIAGRGRVLVFSLGSATSGIPAEWAAGDREPGVHLLPDLSEETARQTAARIRAFRRPGDVVVASIHWGSNWGYAIPEEQVRFARRLVEEGVDLVHGHSSHHVRAFEIYRGRPVLYGCGDFIDDYEGIGGHEAFRSDLRLAYVAALEPATGRLAELRLVPLQVRRFRLRRAAEDDAAWLCNLLNRIGAEFGTRVHPAEDGHLLAIPSGPRRG
jgi:poly-gamma-glutamate capsule biosynthesis protein CapA/YwtB (metallophosphatase superfamily)